MRVPPARRFHRASELLKRYRRDFMRENPVLAALDTDRDGEISAAEIANSAAALKSLNINNDGRLTPYELLPTRQSPTPRG